MQLDMVPVRDGDGTAERRYAVVRALYDRDLPQLHPLSPELVVGGVRYPQPGVDESWWIACVDGEDAGDLMVRLPRLDNTHTVTFRAHVAHEHRRRGIGTQLLERAVEVARDAGRVHLITDTIGPVHGPPPPGAAFLERHGFKPALDELASVLDLRTVDGTALDAMAVEARETSTGYTVETWDGPPPDDDACAQIGLLEGTLSEDAPVGDLAWEREQWDAERVRTAHDNLRRMGVHSLHAVARAGDGRIVAWTQLVTMPSEPTWAEQWATVVDPAHRGHRLGAAVKTANLAVLRERFPTVQRIETCNAEDNVHMLRVNRAMGFVAVARIAEHQRNL